MLRQLEGGGGVMAALEALLRLRQACCHPSLVPGQTLDTSAKLDLLIDRLETASSEGHRSLVFSQWTSLLDKVEPRLAAAGLDHVRLDGTTRDRAAVVARFQAEDGPPVFLISLRAGGTGLNLTAADHVFLLDPWWNPAVEDQAADRAHRIGQGATRRRAPDGGHRHGGGADPRSPGPQACPRRRRTRGRRRSHGPHP